MIIVFQSVVYGDQEQTFRGPSRPYLYGGLSDQACQQPQAPSYDILVKNKILQEKRFFVNNSASKWLSMGVLPKAIIFGNKGFEFEIFLCGEKSSPLPLGGLAGLMSLFSTIRRIPVFSHVAVPDIRVEVQPSENITISTVDFADEVYIYI